MQQGTEGAAPKPNDDFEAGPVYKGMAGSPSACTAAPKPDSLAASEEVAPASPSSSLSPTRADLEFVLAADVLYHRSRQGFLAASHRWCMFGTIFFGAAAAGTLVTPATGGVLIALLGAADLCFDFVGKAQIHADLVRRYMAIVKGLAAGEAAAAAQQVYMEVSVDEPPSYPTVELMSHNAAILSLGRDKGSLEPIIWWRRLLRHLVQV